MMTAPMGRAAWLALAASLFTGAPPSVTAQVPTQSRDTAELRRMAEQQLGPGVSQDEILRRLQESGMTRGQVQSRLQQMGYDPRLADRYFDALEGRGSAPASPSPDLVRAMDDMGMQLREAPEPLSSRLPTIDTDSAVADAEASRIFGKTLFARATTQFDPVRTGPVSRDYRLGPGDQIWLIMTGDVERTYPLDVTREGFLIIPQVGQVPVNGLTLDELEERLYTYLGRAYSGVRRGPEATTQFQISLGEMRPNHVFVVGEVERPSGYQVGPMAEVFDALYQAGGPNETGSFRRVLVRRGGRLVAEVDLYPYLVAGEVAEDVRLEQGDMVFVPVAGPRVLVEGAVRRDGFYELKEGEGLRDVLAFAGGFQPEAVLQRVQIDRILPPAERGPGRERALIDVDVRTLADPEAADVPLRDGDIVTLFTVSEERRNRVAVAGGVRRPGRYEWQEGMTLADLVARADGLTEGAYRQRALVYRLQEDRTRRMLRASLDGDEAALLPLADRDSVVVLREDSLRLPQTVRIAGFVKEPGEYELAEDMSVRDLILAAGGFVEGANMTDAEVARSLDSNGRSIETARVVRVPLASGDADGQTTAGAAADGVPRWDSAAEEFELLRGDRVYVRRAPGYDEPRAVRVTGEVMMPGDYELDSRRTRIAEVLERAGGLTPEAYPDGFTIIRDDRPVPVNLAAALRDPASSSNILLEEGDSLHVPGFDGTVNVVGAVVFEAKVLYEPGRSLQEYINRAGGFTEVADRDGVVVTYPNGERAVRDNVLMFARRPRVEPGSTITVPTVPPGERQGVSWDQIISRTSATLGTLATLLVLLERM